MQNCGNLSGCFHQCGSLSADQSHTGRKLLGLRYPCACVYLASTAALALLGNLPICTITGGLKCVPIRFGGAQCRLDRKTHTRACFVRASSQSQKQQSFLKDRFPVKRLHPLESLLPILQHQLPVLTSSNTMGAAFSQSFFLPAPTITAETCPDQTDRVSGVDASQVCATKCHCAGLLCDRRVHRDWVRAVSNPLCAQRHRLRRWPFTTKSLRCDDQASKCRA
jgi:hypothetical protein